MSLRILISDDEPLVRTGLRMLLERHQDWTICREAGDGIEGVEQAVVLKPDILLLDISMPKTRRPDGCTYCSGHSLNLVSVSQHGEN